MLRNSNKGPHNRFGEGNDPCASGGGRITTGTNFDYCADELDHLLFLDRMLVIAVQ
jgi:hypothetical protein